MTEAMIGAGACGGLIAALFTHGIAVPHVFDAAQRSPQPLIDEVIRPTLQGEAIMLTPAAGDGFASLARHFAVERINLAVTAYATAQRCLDLTVAWVRERETFGRPLVTRQVVRHELVEMHRQIDVARTYTHAVVNELVAETLSDGELLLRAAMAKNTAVAACDNVTAQAVQLHGGYGFLEDSEGNGITATPKSSVSVVAALR